MVNDCSGVPRGVQNGVASRNASRTSPMARRMIGSERLRITSPVRPVHSSVQCIKTVKPPSYVPLKFIIVNISMTRCMALGRMEGKLVSVGALPRFVRLFVRSVIHVAFGPLHTSWTWFLLACMIYTTTAANENSAGCSSKRARPKPKRLVVTRWMEIYST